jgi:hypothetical protein
MSCELNSPETGKNSESFQHHQESETAKNHAHQTGCTKTELSSTSHAALEGDQVPDHKMEICSASHGFALSIVQRRSIRAAIVKAQYQQKLEAGVFARNQAARHVRKYLEAHLQTNTTILRRLTFAIHQKAAELALAQVQRSIHRLHLTHLEDTEGFFADHCGWYRTFCAFMDMACKPVRKVSNSTDCNKNSEQ